MAGQNSNQHKEFLAIIVLVFCTVKTFLMNNLGLVIQSMKNTSTDSEAMPVVSEPSELITGSLLAGNVSYSICRSDSESSQ